MIRRGVWAAAGCAVWLIVMCMQLEVYGAADGWTQERSGWHYYSNGIPVTNEWRRGDEGSWYYLDHDGVMLTDGWVDNEYYVGSDGAMVKEQWRKICGPGVDENDVESVDNWFYFLGTGKCITNNWKKINGKWYHFDDDGAMSYGWYDYGRYYLGTEDDGSMKSGWLFLEDEEGDFSGMGESFYWFDSSGEKAYEVTDKKINGKYYCFDKLGRMLYGWVDVENLVMETDDAASSDIADYQYYGDSEDGARVTGWRNMESPVNCFGTGDGEQWFYFKDGRPFYAEAEQELAILTASGQKYCFNEYGEMQYGLQDIVVADKEGSMEARTYYFGKADDGVMKTGKQNVYDEEDGATYVYYFNTAGSFKGQGITDIRDNAVYKDGKRLDADRSLRYQVVSNGEVTRLVNTSGKIQKASSGKEKVIKDADGNRFTVDDAGEIVSGLPGGYWVKTE